MAVYTHVADDDLRRFLEHYDVGELLSYKGIAEGIENTNYLVHTSKARYILTLYEARVDENDLPFFLNLMEHLSSRGIDCPLPVADKQGEVLKDLAGRRAVMVTFLEGFSLTRPNRHHCEQLGGALASLHLAGRDYDRTRANTLSLQGWQDLFGKCRDGLDSIHPGLLGIVEPELLYLQDNWPSDLPKGIIHADLFPDNVFFLSDHLSGIIDFYFACNDLFAYDLAICLNAWCFERDGGFHMTHARALLSGYEAIRHLEDRELAALPLLARGAALRFLLTRAYDWLNTPEGALVNPKNPREYLRRLRFHQQVKNVGEYGFERSL